MKSLHQQRCEEFMTKAGQTIRKSPAIPTFSERQRCANLIFEECKEVLLDLGFKILTDAAGLPQLFSVQKDLSLLNIADNLTDLDVVVKCAMSACGLQDESLFEEVDNANLQKFDLPKCNTLDCSRLGLDMEHCKDRLYVCEQCLTQTETGPYSREEDGKWIKPLYWKEPNIAKAIGVQE